MTVIRFHHSSLHSLSRAILCNDSLVKKLEELERTEEMYSGLVDHSRRVLMGYFDLVRVSKELGDEFCKIGVREPQKAANEAFCEFGEYHRQMEKFGISMLKKTKPIFHIAENYVHHSQRPFVIINAGVGIAK